MKTNDNKRFVCATCGGHDVEMPMWVKINTNEIGKPFEECTYCPRCLNSCSIMEENKFIEATARKIRLAISLIENRPMVQKVIDCFSLDSVNLYRMSAMELGAIYNILNVVIVLQNEYREPENRYEGFAVEALLVFDRNDGKGSVKESFLITESDKEDLTIVPSQHRQTIMTPDEFISMLTDPEKYTHLANCDYICNNDLPF